MAFRSLIITNTYTSLTLIAMRSVFLLSRGVRFSMDSTSRGAMSRFYSSDKGKILSEEEQAKENVYIQKWEREKLEKQKQQADKVKSEKDKDTADKKPEGANKG